MYEVSNMLYLIRATKPGFFYKLSVNRAHRNANVWLRLCCSGTPRSDFAEECDVHYFNSYYITVLCLAYWNAIM
jgi:hypothetical protein